MTTQELCNDIKNTYISSINAGQVVYINEYIYYISINTCIDEYFFQDEEAQNLFTEYNQLNVSIEEWILWLAQGW